MTENITVTKGSYGYNLAFTLKDSAGNARSLAGYSVKMQVWSPLVPATLLIDAAMSWTDATAGTCYYSVLSTNFTTVGVYCYAIKVYQDTTVIDIAQAGFITVTQYGGNYCILEEIKNELGIDNSNDDDLIQRKIKAVKTAIDDYCHRSFESTAATKYYDGCASPLFIDDLITVTTFSLDEDGDGTYESTLTTSDYVLRPSNNTPKTYVEINPNGDYGGFANGIPDGVKIVGTWGYSTVPEPIHEAAIIQTCRLYKRKDSAFQDVVGTPELGTFNVYKALDPDVKQMLKQYVKDRIC